MRMSGGGKLVIDESSSFEKIECLTGLLILLLSRSNLLCIELVLTRCHRSNVDLEIPKRVQMSSIPRSCAFPSAIRLIRSSITI